MRLPSRPAPLEIDDIQKLDAAVSRYFSIAQNPQYGYVPIRADDGEVIRQEYDVIGTDEIYTPRGETPQSLRDALLRPAERRHIIFHLTRLAAHRRDTRGKEALTAVLEDIAYDLKEVSEWAVVMSCREFRRKGTWYPTTGEIMATIEKNHRKLELLLSPPTKSETLVHQRQGRIAQCKEIRWQDLPKSEWLPQHFDHAISECESILAASVERSIGLTPDYWKSQIEKLQKERAERFADNNIANPPGA